LSEIKQVIPLRPYQETDITKLRQSFADGAQRVLYQAPTGSGKTVLFAAIVAGAAARGNRIVILGHRQEIVDQIGAALAELGVAHGLIAAGHDETPDAMVQVASVATLVRRLDRLAEVDLAVIDEAHHAVAGTWRKITDAIPGAKILGVTATPQRLDGKGLSDIFDTLVIGPSIKALTADGYLAPATCFAPERLPDLSRVRSRAGDFAIDELGDVMRAGVVIGSAVDEYERLCPGVPAIAFCVDIKHSQLVAERFTARGYRAAHVDGDSDKDERRALIAALARGGLQVLANCGLISEGLDVPGVHAALLLRPTRSPALYLQQVGRALRPAPGKDRALILDHAGNVLRHGLPDAPRAWSLAGRAKRVAGDDELLRRCPECGAIIALSCWHCSECGAVLREPPAARVEIESRLVVAERLRVMSYQQAVRWAGRDEDRLRLVAKARGYKRGWIWHRMQELGGAA
jgi:superfamily II DNA or RNA helicase